ncbi:hypothetical protein M2351_006829 [Azospirillum canadense]|nr:hypothetical protein [Azospirillum canadense]
MATWLRVARSAARRPLGGAAHGGEFQRLADRAGLGQRVDGDAGDEGSGLRKDLDQPLVGQLQQRLADGGAADAVGFRDLLLDNGFARPAAQGHDLVAQGAVNAAGRGGRTPGSAGRSLFGAPPRPSRGQVTGVEAVWHR